LITDVDTSTGANLVLPLSGHDLSVGARNVDTSIKAGLVVDVSDDASEGDVGSDRAVVRSLSSGETIVGPSERPASEFGRGSE